MCGVQSYVSSVLFSNKIHKKVCASVCVGVLHGKITAYIFTDLDTAESHEFTLSYDAILKRVNEISQKYTKVMEEWLRGGAFVKFVGDNVDK